MTDHTITIFSDVSFKLLERELPESVSIKASHFGPPVVNLLANRGELSDSRFVLIHSDPIFLRHSEEVQCELLETIFSLTEEAQQSTFLVSNLIFTPPAISRKLYLGRSRSVPQEKLYSRLTERPNVFLIDAQGCFQQVGTKHAYHYGLGHLYQMPYTQQFSNAFGTELRTLLEVLLKPEKKVIVVDADNTLWGGILGEDGLKGLAVDNTAKGITYLHFQQFLLTCRDQGFLLAICSKNNAADVKEAFEKVNMPLRLSDFIQQKINWQNKVDNLKEIASGLNLGLDSLIFIDDSPFELESVKELLPQVSCHLFPSDYAELLALMELPIFCRKQATREDSFRTEHYKLETERQALKQTSSFEDYVRSLEIKVKLSHNEERLLGRAAQLSERTNQFNFNKEIFSEAQLRDFIEQGHHCFTLDVRDRFGDYGTVGLALVEKDGLVRNLLLSCRVLGRGVEELFVEGILSKTRKMDLRLERICFQSTPKNAPALKFLERAKELLRLNE